MDAGLPRQIIESIRHMAPSYDASDAINLDAEGDFFFPIFFRGKRITLAIVPMLQLLPSNRQMPRERIEGAHLDDLDQFMGLLDLAHAAAGDLTDAFTRRFGTPRFHEARARRAARRAELLELQRAVDGDVEVPGLLQPLYPHQRANVKFLVATRKAVLADEPGLGKAVRVDELVATPSGMRRFGDVVVGDMVIGSDGRPTEVLGVYPQGQRECFRVTFSDGVSVECDDEHLWQVSTPGQRLRGKHRVLPLSEVRQKITDADGKRWWGIPMLSAPAEFNPIGDLPLDPYVMGALLADGGMKKGSVTFTKTYDLDVLERFRSRLPEGVELTEKREARSVTWSLVDRRREGSEPHAVIAPLREAGLWGSGAADKFIPPRYLHASVEARLELLRGLMDCDGEVSRDGSYVGYSTTSERLAMGFVFVVQSLGGIARLHAEVKYIPEGKGPADARYGVEGEPYRYWRVTVSMPPELVPLTCARKLARFRPKSKYLPGRTIAAVEPAGRHETRCIKVAAADGLFALSGFVLTHNTRSAAAATVLLRSAGEVSRALVVCTASTRREWQREIRAVFGEEPLVVDGNVSGALCPLVELRGHVYSRSDAKCRACGYKAQCAAKAKAMKPKDFRREQYASDAFWTIANYEVVTRDITAIAGLKRPFDAAIFDEVHRVRNSRTKVAQAVKYVAHKAQLRLGLTGTPIQNSARDIWSIMDVIDPSVFGPELSFRKVFEVEDDWGHVMPVDPDKLYDRLRVVMVRHRKSEVAEGMPEKVRVRKDVEFSPEQREFYDKCKRQALDALSELVSERVNEAQVIAQTMFLREVCDSTELVDSETSHSAKLAVLNDLLEEVLADPSAKIVVYTQFTTMLGIMRRAFDSRWLSEEISGDVKGTVLLGAADARRLGIPVPDGADSIRADARQVAQARFTHDSSVRIMYITDAGGEGINLQAASTLVMFDLPWNPAKITQIEDRIHRIGQKRTCFIYRLVTSGTIEDRVLEVLEGKQELIDRAVDGVSAVRDVLTNWKSLLA